MSSPLALHIFRRDLRLHDNRALHYALREAKSVIPCFIFDPRQVKAHPYKSDHALRFMMGSLQDLHEALQKKKGKLYFFYGIAEEVVPQLCEKLPIGLVTFHRDYTPFAIERDQKIQEALRAQEVATYVAPDALLHEPEAVEKKDGKPYTIFTPFFRSAQALQVPKPQSEPLGHYHTDPIAEEQGVQILAKISPPALESPFLRGGSAEGEQLLTQACQLTQYAQERDFPAIGATSKLSAHHKFGTLSIRHVFHTLQAASSAPPSGVPEALFKPPSGVQSLVRQLYWRDFFTHIAYHFPHIWGAPFHLKWKNIPWENDEQAFQRWCEGTTGYPIVDAGMRELRHTGYMHNRVRMITASFLIKHLHVDWRWGERYFAQQLIDYDPAVNNGNWQWVASTGCDAQPYFRIFNPWRQQERFDPHAIYIKKWLPELRFFLPKAIHGISKAPLPTKDYPPPMVEHQSAVAKTKMLYALAREM